MNKVNYSNRDIRSYVHSIIRQMDADQWRPDYVVGLTRGGLVPALMISHYLSVPMHTLEVSLRDGGETESNCWMACDSFGYNEGAADPAMRKNILIVDDINDSGATLSWIKRDWRASCLPNHSAWDAVWNRSTRFAVVVNNDASEFKDIDYVGTHINKNEKPDWIVFPWERWWE